MFRPEPLDLVLILLVVILLLGAKRIPEIARGMAQGIREFKDALAGKDDQEDKAEEKPREDSEKK